MLKTQHYYEYEAPEQEYLEWYKNIANTQYDKPSVMVDIVIFSYNQELHEVQTLLTERQKNPYRGHLALPGTFLTASQTAEQTVIDDVLLETGITLEPNSLLQSGVFSSQTRDPRGWTVSLPYVVFLDQTSTQLNKDYHYLWSSHPSNLAFDHMDILNHATHMIGDTITRNFTPYTMLEETFTITDALNVYQHYTGDYDIDRSNYKRNMIKQGVFVPTGKKKEKDTAGRPELLFTLNK